VSLLLVEHFSSNRFFIAIETLVRYAVCMPECLLRPARGIFSVTLLYCSSAIAQQPEHHSAQIDQPEKTPLASGIDRISGLESTSDIHYVRLVLTGSFHTLFPPDAPVPSPGPTLIAECTFKPNGKSSLELFANFGGATDLAFYPRGRQPQNRISFLHALTKTS